MGISRAAALTALVASSIAWLACSGEDEGTSKGSGTGTSAGNAGASGSGSLGLGGRPGGGNAGTSGDAGSGGSSSGCLPANAPPPAAACDGTAPQNLAIAALAPLPVVVQLPTILPVPNRPDTFVVRGRGTDAPLVIGRVEAGIARWVVSLPGKQWEEITGAVFVGDDLWVTSGYSPHQLWRCAIDAALSTTCVVASEFPHQHADGSLVAVPKGTCGHPEGALLDLDTPADGASQSDPHDAHLYDIATNAWTTVKRPTGERRWLSQIIHLRDGRALFVGGRDGADEAMATTEIFDGQAITAGPKLGRARFGQGMSLFPDGRLLVTGGYAEGQALPPWEIVDLSAGAAATTTLSPQPEDDQAGRAFAAGTGLFGACGYVSIGGRNGDGASAVDYFAFAKPGFERLVAPKLPAPVEYAAAITLADGSLVYLGGRTPGIEGGPTGEWHGEVYRLFSP